MTLIKCVLALFTHSFSLIYTCSMPFHIRGLTNAEDARQNPPNIYGDEPYLQLFKLSKPLEFKSGKHNIADTIS